VFVGFTCGSAGKESAHNMGDLGSISGLEDPLEKGKAREFHGIAKSRTRVSYFNFTSFTSPHFKAQLVKNLPAMQKLPWRRKWQPTHSSILAWRIPRTEEPGGLQYMGSQRVRHDCATNFNVMR